MKGKVKGKVRWLMISAVLILGIGLIGSGALWGDEAGPPAAGASAGGQTVVAQADAHTGRAGRAQTAPATPSTTGTPETKNVPMTEVTVKAQKEKPATGTVAEGYRVDNTTTTGPWGEMKLQDTPYSIVVMPQELIENTIAANPDQLFKMNPLTQTTFPSTENSIPAVNMRGFYILNPLRDGIPTNTAYGVSVENLDRIEFKSGPSGFLYGAGNVGGWVNYVTKRPTPEPYNSLTVGNYGGDQYYGAADFGGPIDKEGKFGYRINLMDQPNGDTPVQYQSIHRNLFAGAFDWHATDTLLFQVNYEHRDYEQDGTWPAGWSMAPGVLHPSPPDADKLYSQSWTWNKVTTDDWGSNAKWDISDIFTFRTAYRHQEDTRQLLNASNTLQANGTYTQFVAPWAPNYYINDGYYAYLDSKFETWFIQHVLTAGYNGTTWEYRLHVDNTAGVTLTGLTLADPDRPEPVFGIHGVKPVYTPQAAALQNFVIGDDIKFNEQWSALVGANDARVEAKNAYAGSTHTFYDKEATTPTLSLIYKPIPWISTYATYMEALEQGSIVPPTGYANSGAILEPLVDHQYEVGIKATVADRVLLTSALFRIDKANQYSIPTAPLPTYVQDGREMHQGMEFTATGKVTDRFTILGGFTLMDCTVEKTNTAALVGKRPTNVANEYAKLYAEYALPWITGLTLQGGVFWTGDQFADAANTDLLPAYTVADVGARYERVIFGQDTIFRLYVSNLANKSYWAQSSVVGYPRTIAFNVQVKF